MFIITLNSNCLLVKIDAIYNRCGMDWSVMSLSHITYLIYIYIYIYIYALRLTFDKGSYFCALVNVYLGYTFLF